MIPVENQVSTLSNPSMFSPRSRGIDSHHKVMTEKAGQDDKVNSKRHPVEKHRNGFGVVRNRKVTINGTENERKDLFVS